MRTISVAKNDDDDDGGDDDDADDADADASLGWLLKLAYTK